MFLNISLSYLSDKESFSQLKSNWWPVLTPPLIFELQPKQGIQGNPMQTVCFVSVSYFLLLPSIFNWKKKRSFQLKQPLELSLTFDLVKVGSIQTMSHLHYTEPFSLIHPCPHAHLFQLDEGVTWAAGALSQVGVSVAAPHPVAIQVLGGQMEVVLAVHTGPDRRHGKTNTTTAHCGHLLF